MALLLNKYSSILDTNNEEDEIPTKIMKNINQHIERFATLRRFYGIAFSRRKVCVVLYLLEQKSIAAHAYQHSL